jgi:hypothetical protein
MDRESPGSRCRILVTLVHRTELGLDVTPVSLYSGDKNRYILFIYARWEHLPRQLGYFYCNCRTKLVEKLFEYIQTTSKFPIKTELKLPYQVKRNKTMPGE